MFKDVLIIVLIIIIIIGLYNAYSLNQEACNNEEDLDSYIDNNL